MTKPSRETVFVFPPFRLDCAQRQLWCGERLLPIKPKTFAVLSHLVASAGELVTREDLAARFWGDVHTSDGVLKTLIREIRQTLGDCAREARFIQTERSHGYRFIARLESSPAPARAATADQAAVSSGWPTRCRHRVGRQAELQALATYWERARQGERQVVFVTGEAGIGKTALVSAFLQEHLRTEPDAVIAWGQCIDQYGAGESYLPIIEALGRACRAPAGGRLVACLRQNAPTWCAQMPNLFLHEHREASNAVGAPASHERMLSQIVDALEALSRDVPLLLLIEDLHWADHSTLDLLGCAAERTDPARLLVIGTYRPPESLDARAAVLGDALKARNKCASVSVPPLPPEAVAAYLNERFGTDQLPPTVAKLLHARSNGNALFMVGVVDGWLERGLLSTVDGVCKTTADSTTLGRYIPETFVSMIERALDREPALERSVLDAASVAGCTFAASSVAAAIDVPLLAVEELAVRWARRGKYFRIKETTEWADGTISQSFEFVHALYRQVTYDQLSASRRTEWHRRIGERLEAGHSPKLDSIAAELAVHFQEGREYDRAVRYLRMSAEQALGRGAYREALDHVRFALELTTKLSSSAEAASIELDLLIVLAALFRITKGFGAEEVEQTYRRAAEACKARGATTQHLQLLAGMGAVYIMRGAMKTALEHGRDFRALANRHEDAYAVAEADLVIGSSLHALGEHHEAIQHLDQVVVPQTASATVTPLSLGGRNPAVLARCFAAVSSCLVGRLDDGLSIVERALGLARDLADPFALAFAYNFCGHVRHLRREPEASREAARALLGLSEQYGLELLETLAHAQLARYEIERGDVRLGIVQLEQAWHSLDAMCARLYRTDLMALLAQGYARVGQHQRALDIVEQALGDVNVEHERAWQPELLRIRGELLAGVTQAGRCTASAQARTEAERSLVQAVEVAQQQSAKLLELRASSSLARLWRASGRPEAAWALLSTVYGSFQQGLGTADLVAVGELISELSRSA